MVDNPVAVAPFASRGIARAAQWAGYRAGTFTHDGERLSGWRSPVFDADGKAITNADGKPTIAFKNAGDGPHDLWANYAGFKPYILPPKGIKKYISASNGLLFGSEGKADTLTLYESLRETGIINVVGFFGTSFIPDTLAADFLNWGVRRFVYYCHPDARRVAQQIVNLLNGSGINVEIYLLPTDEGGEKIDLNDLWQLVHFDAEQFRARLATLQRLDLIPEPARTPTAAPALCEIKGNGVQAFAQRKAQRRLERCISDLASRGKNDHWKPLTKWAFELGHWSACGLLTYEESWPRVREALRSNGYIAPRRVSERTAERQFKSAFDKGRNKPGQPQALINALNWYHGRQRERTQRPALATANPANPQKQHHAFVITHVTPLPIPSTATSRDGIRSAALNCDLDAALIVRELAILAGKQPGDKITRPELKAFNKQLGTNINERLIDRGVNQGAETNRQNQGKSLFFTTSSPDFVEKSGVAKKRAVEFTLLPDSDVKPGLKAMLVSRLAYRYYPLSGNPDDLLPLAGVTPDVYRAVVSEIDDLTPEQSRQLRAALEDASGLQNAQDSGWRFEEFRSALRKLYRWLDSSHSTELPVGLWTNGAQFRAVFYRRVHDADPKNRSHRTIALLTGVNPGNVGPIIERAALENHKQDPAIIRFPLTKTLSADIRRAAAQQGGKVDEVYALRDERRISASGFDVKGGRFQQWAEAQKRAGIGTVEVKMYVPAKQVAVGDVQPAKPRQKSTPKNSDRAANPAPPKPPVETKPRRRKASSYPQWRDLLLETAYTRLTRRDGETAHSNLRSLIALALQTPVQDELTRSEVSEPMHTPVERDDPYLDTAQPSFDMSNPEPEPQIDLSDFPKPPPPPSAETRAALARLELKRREDADRRLNPHLYREVMTS